jgi:hypothetical protein
VHSLWNTTLIAQAIASIILGSLSTLVLLGVIYFFQALVASENTEKVKKEDSFDFGIEINLLEWQTFLITAAVAMVPVTLAFAVIFLIVDAVIGSLPYLLKGYLWLLKLTNIEVTQSIIAFGVVLLGFGAYRFKKAKQRVYGAVEVLFSASSVIVALKTTNSGNKIGLATALIGATYVGSRGFANFFEAKSAQKVASQGLAPGP